MNQTPAIAWIHAQNGLGKKEGLTNSRLLLARLGNPERAYPIVHVAGTNGKGSTCMMIAQALQACGLQVGLYTSPFIEKYNERMQVNQQPISDDHLEEITHDIRLQVEDMALAGTKATVFEIGTACAFAYFQRQKVDIAVIEVGIGGRLDPTNVITPTLSVITHIGLDHTKMLGNTIKEIAWEKAGIIKEDIPLVLYPQTSPAHSVIKDICKDRNAPFLDASHVSIEQLRSTAYGHDFTSVYDGQRIEYLHLSLPGAHQIDNARTAIAALYALQSAGFPIDAQSIRSGLANTRWPGRLEWRGNVLLDGAHNPQGATALADYIKTYFPKQKVTMVCGILQDKAVEDIISILAPIASKVYCVEIDSHRTSSTSDLAQQFALQNTQAIAATSLKQALSCAKEDAGEQGIVLVCGSLYLVGQARSIL